MRIHFTLNLQDIQDKAKYLLKVDNLYEINAHNKIMLFL